MGCHFTREKENELALPLTDDLPQPRMNITRFFRNTAWDDFLPIPLPVLLGLLVGTAGCYCIGFWKFLGALAVFCIFALPVYQCMMWWIGKKLKSYIEEIDRDVIGVDVTMEKVDLRIFAGRLVIHDLLVKNPEGYHSPYLVKASQVVFDLHVEATLKSWAKSIVIEELGLHSIDLIVEYNSMVFGHGVSNVQTILDFMKSKKAKKAKKPEDSNPESPPRSPRSPRDRVPSPRSTNDSQGGSCDRCAGCLTCQSPESKTDTAKKKKKRDIVLHQVDFIDVSAQMATTLTSTTLACTDLRWKNFTEEAGQGLGIADIISILFMSLIKSVMANVTSFLQVKPKK